MIVLDTNVLSEPLRPAPDPRVVAWLDAQHVETLWLTTVTTAELRYGVAVLPAGSRKRLLEERIETEIFELFGGRILAFDEPASLCYAQLQAAARRAGRPHPIADAMIAAMAKSRGFALATRNTKDFEGAGIDLVNPWQG